MDNLRRLEEIFAKFPGIGPRQARRFVYYLLNKSPSYIKDFTTLVENVKKETAECGLCHRIFIDRNVKQSSCSICSDNSRDRTTLMVVARDSDYESIERSGAYRGLYFILGGTVPILDKEPETRIRLRLLLERISSAAEPFSEIILSLNTTPDGEHTAEIVREGILKIVHDPGPRLTVLGRGLSTGTELEYVDSSTIKSALENRH